MKRCLMLLGVAAVLISTTGCVSLFYSHETVVDTKTRREVGLLGIPMLDKWQGIGHGLLPVYIETESNVK